MDAPEPRALHDACRSASDAERDEAYEQLGLLLHAIAWRRVAGDPRFHHLAEESMQEALLIVWRHLEDDRGPDPDRFIGWAATIVINKVREGIRRLNPKGTVGRTKRVAVDRQQRFGHPVRPGGRAPKETLEDDAARRTLERTLRREAARDLVRRIGRIQRVSEQSRTVLLKGFIEGWDDGELAEHLGTTRANIHVIRSRDLAKLREERAFMEQLRALYAPSEASRTEPVESQGRASGNRNLPDGDVA